MQKKLLQKEALAWSPIVANNSMNRERKAIGINSYEKDIYFNPMEFLLKRQEQKIIRWLDLCCGKGNALIQTAKLLEDKGIAAKYQLEGIDLVDFFTPTEDDAKLIFSVQNLEDWQPKQNYDLITIVHGLHYVGDKLRLIQKAVSALTIKGYFIGNLDINNIKIQGINPQKRQVLRFFESNGIKYNSRKKIIYSTGKKDIISTFNYLGADDKAGPNYTGQSVVNAYYDSK